MEIDDELKKHIENRYVKRMIDDCTSEDFERNGCRADTILFQLLNELGMPALAECYMSLDVRRA